MQRVIEALGKLKDGQSLVIGSQGDSGLVVVAPGVEKQHARVSRDGERNSWSRTSTRCRDVRERPGGARFCCAAYRRSAPAGQPRGRDSGPCVVTGGWIGERARARVLGKIGRRWRSQ